MKNSKTIIFVLLITALSGLTILYFVNQIQKNISQKSNACAQDTKVCEDGSLVNRTGPNCEFAPCPVNSQCTQDSNCEVVYGGDIPCPCFADINDENYICATKEEAKKIRTQRKERIGNVDCEMCLDYKINFKCKCDNGNCKKVEKDDTADWLTYRNEEYGFEIKYPPYLTAEQSPSTFYFKKEIDQKINGLGLNYIFTVKKTDFKNTNDWFEAEKKFYENSFNYENEIINPRVDLVADLKINELEIKKYIVGDGLFPFYDICAAFVKNGRLHLFCYEGGAMEDDYSSAKNGTDKLGRDTYDNAKLEIVKDKYRKIFDQMVSTIKLVGSSTNKIADWQTYRNEDLGFELKYPVELEIITGKNSVRFHKNCSSLRNDGDLVASMRCDLESDISFEIYNKNLDQFIEEYKNDCKDGSCLTSIVKQSDYVLDNIQGEKLEGNNAEGVGGGYFIFVTKNNTNYLISYLDDDLNDFQLKMLSTFKFISTATNETADWQTYRNEEYGFEFKYPENWFIYEQKNQKRLYIQTVQGEVTKETKPTNFRRVWIEHNYKDTEEKNESLMKLADAKKSVILSNEILMNYYEWLDVDTNELTGEAYWKNNKGDRYMADCASEVGVNNSEQEVAVLKSILSTFKFTN